MSRKNRLSRDQKRKKKLAQRRGQALPAYHDWKYRSAEFVEIIFRGECGIREADAITGESLTDHEVRASLEYLIGKLKGHPPEPPGYASQESEDGSSADLVAARIEDHWQELFQKRSRPSSDDLVGCLHTILDSVQKRCSSSPQSRGYLDYLVGFLAQAGFRVQRVEDVKVDEEGNPMLPAAPYRPRGNWLTRLFKRW